MIDMNYQVNVEGKQPADVAREFLKRKDYWRETKWNQLSNLNKLSKNLRTSRIKELDLSFIKEKSLS